MFLPRYVLQSSQVKSDRNGHRKCQCLEWGDRGIGQACTGTFGSRPTLSLKHPRCFLNNSKAILNIHHFNELSIFRLAHGKLNKFYRRKYLT